MRPLISNPYNTFLLDCDGVCSDFIAQLRAVCVYESIPFPENTNTWNILPQFGENLQRVYDLICRPGFCSKMPKMLRAQSGVLELSNMGFDVVIVTAPFVSSRVWEIERRAWLRKNLRIEKENVIFTFRKELICGATLVDDRPEYVNKWSQVHKRPSFLFDSPYNRKEHLNSYVTRVRDWNDLLEKVAVLRPDPDTVGFSINPFDPVE